MNEHIYIYILLDERISWWLYYDYEGHYPILVWIVYITHFFHNNSYEKLINSLKKKKLFYSTMWEW